MPRPRSLLGKSNSLLGDGSVLSAYEPSFREKATDMIRGLLFSDDREGQRRAEKVSNLFETVTPYQVATGIDDAREAFGQGNYGTAGTMMAMAVVPGFKGKGIRAFHGSPHSFDKFSMDKIGTGEGAQAYGHGLYFADSEGVAKSYRDALSVNQKYIGGKPEDISDPVGQAASVLADHKGNRVAAIAELREVIQGGNVPKGHERTAAEMLRILETGQQLPDVEIRPNPGSMYEVNINADPDSFLDWDKPLSEQPSTVQDAINRVGREVEPYGLDRIAPDMRAIEMQKMLQDPKATQRLKDKGIPGIKYLDAGSRPPTYGPYVQDLIQQFGSKQKALEVARQRLSSASSPRDQIKAQEAVDALSIPETRNYVVFDDKLISIVRKYGIAGASAMLGYNLLDGVSESQAAQLKQAERK